LNSKESEYRELFQVESLENFEELNRLFTDLEKDHDNENAINTIFRIIHTLKGNAMGIGINDIAELSHVMEDIFGAAKSGEIELNDEIFSSLFKANDKLGEMIQGLKTNQKISYLGIKTKLTVLLKNSLNRNTEEATKKIQSEKSVPAVSHTEKPEQVDPDKQEMLDFLKSKTSEIAPTAETFEQIKSEITFTDVIQMPVKKMDELMNLVGQLIIERDRLVTESTATGLRTSEFERLLRISSDLQYSVMNARMVQIGFLFNKFHRIVRDVAAFEKKHVNLVLKGTEVEIDRNILKIMSDSLIHLVRNAVSHGIESVENRKAAKKPDIGTITLNARYEKDNVLITVTDDGHGIDPEAIRKKIIEKKIVSPAIAEHIHDEEVMMYIFEPGFSNAEKITEISGRGVGMDVAKKAAESIGGQITLDTKIGRGTTINLMLPSSMALKGALLFMLDQQEYAVALSYTEAVLSLYKKEIHKISDGLMANFQDKTISVIFLKDIINLENLEDVHNQGIFHQSYDQVSSDGKINIIVVSYAGRHLGIVVDKLLQQKEIIEKSLLKPLDKTRLLSGTTILGNGNVCLVIDVSAIADILFKVISQKTIVSENPA